MTIATQGHLAARAAFVLSLVLVLLAWMAIWRSRSAGGPEAVDVGLGLFAIAMFLTPVTAGAQFAHYRSHLLLAPVLLTLRHLPVRVLWLLAAVCAPVAYGIATLFFRVVLI